MHTRLYLLLALATLLVTACAPQESRPIRANELPMYGGMDRRADPRVASADNDFVQGVVAEFGSAEAASRAFVDKGFDYYNSDSHTLAMRRFNQAWLLNPDNPEVYRGFGSVAYDSGQNCEAMALFEMGLEKDMESVEPNWHGLLVDAALVTSLCAVDPSMPAKYDKQSLLDRSDTLFERAESLQTTAYLYDKWWQSHYWRGNYKQAWAKVHQMRAQGEEPFPGFLIDLRRKMEDPGPTP